MSNWVFRKALRIIVEFLPWQSIIGVWQSKHLGIVKDRVLVGASQRNKHKYAFKQDYIQMHKSLIFTFSFEFVFLSPEKWYLNLFLRGERSSSRGRTSGSLNPTLLNPFKGVLDDASTSSSSFINILKSFENFFSCFFQISACLEEIDDDTNGHLISFRTAEKSLQNDNIDKFEEYTGNGISPGPYYRLRYG